MRLSSFKGLRLGLTLLALAVLLLGGSLGPAQQARAQSAPAIGMVCSYGVASGTSKTFDLDARDGYIILGDGNTVYMWSFAPTGGAFQHPGPVLCVNEGDTVTVNLHNALKTPVSIMFPGQENVQANGALTQPELDANTGQVTSLTNSAPAGGGATYSFVAGRPGTYIYESGTDPETQVRMGLFGALIVRPAMGANFAYNRADSQFTPEEEFLVLLSEVDPYQHQALERGLPYNLNNYHVHYWLINGRTFPDSVADNFAGWLPNQPYGALARIHPYDATNHPYPGVARYINVGSENYPHHPHGNNGVVIGRDGNPLEGPAGQDLSFEKFDINIGPGQTWDVLFKWYDAENYGPANPVTVTQPDNSNLTMGMFYSGGPYLGIQGTLPPGTSTLNQCGEYYIISHNHALFQLDAWGVTMAGQITYLRVDPPLPNNCP
jgi:FtsP/CotA-like multicopper oxidase with cupredoxin domain